jgi:hypothetical protein
MVEPATSGRGGKGAVADVPEQQEAHGPVPLGRQCEGNCCNDAYHHPLPGNASPDDL